MNVIRLRLENFKRHTELEMDLAPGLNIIRGSNEAGKTTIQRALEMVLFRRATSSSQDLDDARPWRDQEADPAVEMDFDEDGVKGKLRKTFAGQRGTVELQLGDETFTDAAAVETQVAKLTGLPSEKFFRATASVHHEELDGLTQDESTLRDRLQQSMSGADRGTHAARKKLEDAIRRYKTEGAKNPGYLKVMRGDVDRLREDLKKGEAALNELESDRRTLGEALALRISLDAQLSEKSEGVAMAERAAALTAKATDASRRYAHYKRAAELQSDIARLEASHPSAVPLATLKSTIASLRNQEFGLSEMRAELAAEPDLSGYDVAIAVPRWRPWALLAVALFIGAAGAAAAGFATDNLIIGLVAAAVLGAVAVVVLWKTIDMRRRVNDVRMQNELRESEIGRRLSGRTDLAQRVRQAEQERAQSLGSVGQSDIAAAETVLAAETDHVAQLAAKKAEYKGILGDEPESEDAGALRDLAAAEADECRHTLTGMGEIGIEPAKHLAAFKLAVQRLTPEREAALQAEAQSEARVSTNDVDAEKVAGDAESLDVALESLAAAERRLRIYEDVLATLNSAEAATMKKAARFLEQKMAGDIERITGGRYRRLRVDEQTLTFSVYSPEMDDWMDVRRLSDGTVDQLYLCARLGIVHQVTQPANPPLIFDDPFITFDDERAHRAIEVLKDIARDHQVIFLTTSDRYDSAADKVIELPTPADRDEPDASELTVAAGGPVETLSMWSASVLPLAEPKAARSNGNGKGGGDHAAEPRREPVVDALPVAVAPAVEHEPLWPAEDRLPVGDDTPTEDR